MTQTYNYNGTFIFFVHNSQCLVLFRNEQIKIMLFYLVVQLVSMIFKITKFKRATSSPKILRISSSSAENFMLPYRISFFYAKSSTVFWFLPCFLFRFGSLWFWLNNDHIYFTPSAKHNKMNAYSHKPNIKQRKCWVFLHHSSCVHVCVSVCLCVSAHYSTTQFNWN